MTAGHFTLLKWTKCRTHIKKLQKNDFRVSKSAMVVKHTKIEYGMKIFQQRCDFRQHEKKICIQGEAGYISRTIHLKQKLD